MKKYNKIIKELRKIFEDRGRQYGDSKEKDVEYFVHGAMLKTYRAREDLKTFLKTGEKSAIKRDTTIDLINYFILILSMGKIDE